MNLKTAREALQRGYSILKKYGLVWVSAGTALGLYRDGDLIPHDSDVDVEILEKDWSGAVEKDLMANGFRDYVTTMAGNGVIFQRAYYYGDVVFDIYSYVLDKEEYISTTIHGVLHMPAHMLENMETVQGYNIPSPPEEYLTHRFGNWRVPAEKKVEWQTEAKNLRSLTHR